jgi:hypothetical protein
MDWKQRVLSSAFLAQVHGAPRSTFWYVGLGCSFSETDKIHYHTKKAGRLCPA